MGYRLSIATAAATLAMSLCACGSDQTSANAGADAPAIATQAAARSSASTGASTRNHIELSVDDDIFRADTASSLGLRFQGDTADPRYDVTMTSGWIGNNEMSIVKLHLLNLDGYSRSVSLEGRDSHQPVLMLSEIPGRKGRRWRSMAGTLHLKFDDDAFAQPGMVRLSGHFQATLQQLHQYRDEVLDDGEQITVAGRFDFSRGAL